MAHVDPSRSSSTSPPITLREHDLASSVERLARFICPACSTSPTTIIHDEPTDHVVHCGKLFHRATCRCQSLTSWLPGAARPPLQVADEALIQLPRDEAVLPQDEAVLPQDEAVIRAQSIFLRAAQRGAVDVVDPAELTLRLLAQQTGGAA